MPKAVWIALLAYCGLMVVFVAMYLLGSTQFDLPKGPPIIAALSAAVLYAAASGAARLRR
jgi:hypothetical protein